MRVVIGAGQRGQLVRTFCHKSPRRCVGSGTVPLNIAALLFYSRLSINSFKYLGQVGQVGLIQQNQGLLASNQPDQDWTALAKVETRPFASEQREAARHRRVQGEGWQVLTPGP